MGSITYTTCDACGNENKDIKTWISVSAPGEILLKANGKETQIPKALEFCGSECLCNYLKQKVGAPTTGPSQEKKDTISQLKDRSPFNVQT